MAYPKNVWNQIKGLRKEEIVAALLRDGWEQDPASRGATVGYIKRENPQNRRIVIHRHPGMTCGPGLLKALLEDIGWNEEDLRRLKLIKR